MRSRGRLVLIIRRAMEYVVDLRLGQGRTLGCNIKSDPLLKHILITGLHECGLAEELNNCRAEGEPKIQAGDRIIEANGTCGTSLELLKLLKGSEDPGLCRFRFQRATDRPTSAGPVDVSRLTCIARDNKGLLPQPLKPAYKIAIIQVYVRSRPFGGVDKTSSGHRYDSIPLANGMVSNGMSCQLLHYVHEEHAEFLATCKGFDALIVRCPPGHVVSDGGDFALFCAALRQLQGEGLQIWSMPDVVDRMGANNAVVKIRDLNIGLPDSSSYDTPDAFASGFRKTVAFQPRLFKPSTGTSRDMLWIVELESGNYCQLFGQRWCSDEDKLLLTDPSDGHVEEHTVGEFIEFCVNGRTRKSGQWSCADEGRYFAKYGLVDQRFCPRAAEEELRYYMVGDEVASIVHKTRKAVPSEIIPHDCNCSGGCSCSYTYYYANEPRFELLTSTFMQQDIPGLMAAFELGAEPLPLWWTVDFANTSPKGTSIEQERWAAAEFGVACVGMSPYLASCCSVANPYACVDCVPPKERADGTDLGHAMGTLVLDVLSGDYGCGLETNRSV